MKRKLRIGVIGLKAGRNHVKDYINSLDVESVVICDRDAELLKKVGDEFAIQSQYSCFGEMLYNEKLDVVSNALPNHLHMPISIQAMKAGCHVLVEKPMGRTAEEAEEMFEISKQYNRKLMINFNQRFTPMAQAVRAMIENGELGDIYFAKTTWHRRRGVPRWYQLSKDVCGGGPLLDLGVHMLDKTMWFCGYPEPEWVLGNAFSAIEKQTYPDYELEDMGVAMIRMKNGMILELEASWACNCEKEEITTVLHGTKGGLSIGTGKDQFFMEMNGKLVNVELVEGQFGNSPIGLSVNIRQAFIDAIINDTPVPATPEQGLVVNQIIDAIYQCSETGVPIKI